MKIPRANPFGNLVESGALAPRGSPGPQGNSGNDDIPDPTGPGTVPVWASNSVTPLIFLVAAFLIWRVAAR